MKFGSLHGPTKAVGPWKAYGRPWIVNRIRVREANGHADELMLGQKRVGGETWKWAVT